MELNEELELLEKYIQEKNVSELKKLLIDMNEYDIASFLSDYKDDASKKLKRVKSSSG